MDVTAEQVRFDERKEVGLIAEFRRKRDEFLSLWQEHEGLYTQAAAARELGVSRQTVQELLKDGQLKRIELDQAIYVSGRSIEARLAGKRKPGRPRLIDSFDLGKKW